MLVSIGRGQPFFAEMVTSAPGFDPEPLATVNSLSDALDHSATVDVMINAPMTCLGLE